MKARRIRPDDILFLSAVTAVLLGVALLLHTTRTLASAPSFWPLFIMGIGGLFLYFSLVRGASPVFFLGGLVFALEGCYMLVSVLLGWSFDQAWPLGMAIAGLTGIACSFRIRFRARAYFAVPSLAFLVMGLAFSAFSFRWVQGGFLDFIAVWWPCLLIVGGIILFIAYGLSLKARSKAARERRKDRHDGA